MAMRKILHFLSIIILAGLAFCVCACQKSGVDVKGQETNLTGTWNGTGNALGHDRNYSCDNISITFDSDGTFQMKDVIQNTEIYSGTFSDQSGTIILSMNGGGSHVLPAGWVAASGRMELNYLFPSEDKLVLTCQNISYFFVKDHMTFFWSGTPLLGMVENDVWYSDNLGSALHTPLEGDNAAQASTASPAASQKPLEDGKAAQTSTASSAATPGLPSGTDSASEDKKAGKSGDLNKPQPEVDDGPAYILKLYDYYMEVYSLDEKKDNTVHFENNFFYLYSRDDTFTFYTYNSSKQKLPHVFDGLPDGFSQVNIDFYPSDDTLVLTSAAGSTAFYNNVMYGSSYSKPNGLIDEPGQSSTALREKTGTGEKEKTGTEAKEITGS